MGADKTDQIISQWSAQRRVAFAADWYAGVACEALAGKYHLSGETFGAVRKICGALQLAKRSRIKPKTAPAEKTKLRKCLMHGGTFKSTGPGHRVCDTCKTKSAWHSDENGSYHVAAPGVGRTPDHVEP